MRYYSTKPVSDILNLSIKTVQKLIRNKKLNSFRIGGRYLVEETELKKFIEKTKV